MVTPEKQYTVEDVWELAHLPQNDGKRFELIEGEIITMHPPGGTHGRLALKLGSLMLAFVTEHALGEVTVETGYHPPEDKTNLFSPDVAFIRAERAPDPWPDEYVPAMPDLAIEVVSPNDRADDIQSKVLRYLRAGTRLVWIVYPKSQSVAVHTESGSQTVDADGTLDGDDALPGFALAVNDLFA